MYEVHRALGVCVDHLSKVGGRCATEHPHLFMDGPLDEVYDAIIKICIP